MSRLQQVVHAHQKPEEAHVDRVPEGETFQVRNVPEQLLLQDRPEEPHASGARRHREHV